MGGLMFKGVYTAIVTPFKDDLSIDYDAYRNLLEFQIESGVDGIVVNGTTGEASTLEYEEVIELVKYTVEIVDNRVKVIAGTGSNSTAKAIKLSQDVEKLGVDGLLIVTPYYNKGNEEGIYQHYKEIASSVELPIILYNVPSRTGVDLSINNIVRLSEIKNIVGIKEASGNLDKIKVIYDSTKDFSIFSGNDDQIFDILNLGGVGVISVLSNIFPEEVKTICDAYDIDPIISRILQDRYLPFINTLFIEPNPIPVKEALCNLGYCSNNYRLPLYQMSSTNRTLLLNELSKLKRG